MAHFRWRLSGACLVRALAFVAALFAAAQASAINPDLLRGLDARAIGPAAVSGRITAIDVEQRDPRRILVGTATGGVWLTANAGLTFDPIFDDQPYASIGAVAIDQSNPDVLWIGTGEGNVRNSTSIGGGIFKSVDGGHSWKLMGLAGSERINRIAIDPRDGSTVYVAAMGTLWGPNQERGVYRTHDGGETWERILFVDENSGATDVKLDPHNPDRVFAAMWQFRRWPYHFKFGGPGSGMYVSNDGGDTFTQRTEEDGLPKGELGRMVFAPSKARPNLVYALVEATKSALLRSDDAGRSWTSVNTDHNVADRPFYYTELAADPVDARRIYNIATRVRVSIDGGKNFETNPVIECCAAGNFIHIDNHAFWINPNDPKHLIVGNDGGIGISHDRGETFRFVRNLPLAQFYHVAVDDDHPYHVYGGLQDNGSWRGPAEVFENGGIRNLHWQEVGFGDGFDTRPDPRNSRRGYAMSQGGYLIRWDLDSGERRPIFPVRAGDEELRFNWNAALAIDPHQPDTIYYASQFVHKSTDRGETWTTISPDLTSDNPEYQTFQTSGGLTSDVTAAENYTSIVALAVSPLDQQVIWVGSDDGRVHVTRDGGANWDRVDEDARGVAGAWVPMITPSRFEVGTAYVVFDDHRRSDMTPYAFRATGFGNRWQRFEDGDLRGYALSVAEDHMDRNLLFLGTELGLFFSTDGGEDWHPWEALPTVSVMDMAIQSRENDLVLGTHGRAIYVVDDYSALRGLRETDFSERLKILSTTPGQQYQPLQTPSTRFTGSGEYRAENEPYGVMITFMASGDDLVHPDETAERERKIRRRELESAEPACESEQANDDKDQVKPLKVTMTIETPDGQLVRKQKFAVSQGINRIVWDLSSEGVRPMPGPEPAELDDGLPSGPEVPPGNYRATLHLGDHTDAVTASVDVTVTPDPRTPHTANARLASYQASRDLLQLRERAVAAVESIAHARDDLKTIEDLIKRRSPDGDDASLESLKKRASDLKGQLDEIEKRFRVPPRTKGIVFDDDRVANRIGAAAAYTGSTWDAPGAAAQRLKDIAIEALVAAESDLTALLEGEVADFRRELAAAGIGLLGDVE